MGKYSVGDLTPGTAIIGRKVRCIALPNVGPWILLGTKNIPTFILPELRQVYTIRGNTLAGSFSGIVLQEIRNPRVLAGILAGEPFFDHKCFNLIPLP